MSNLLDAFPILEKHAGQWSGEYVHITPEGEIVDRHASHLNCWLPDDGSCDITQINTYTWDDGRQQSIEFNGHLRGKDVWFDNDRIIGHMHQTDDLTILLTWRYKSATGDGDYLYELIQLSKDGQQKIRTWHWMEGDRVVKRTVIQELRVK
ncbi:MAG: hypothetical protein M0026_03465 [Nocardiopsaceae bacterium]|nr:hypothetical protein [Nocardiopsaceae bacterium]